jgi:AcrR family transcriptional regulator
VRVTRADQILETARACFTEQGYAATTIEQIAARSGASNGSIYHHFGSKDGILATLYVRALAAYQGELLALLRAAGDDAEAGIRGAVEHHLAWVEAHPDETRTLFEHRQALERSPRADALAEQNREGLREVRAWLARQVDAGRLRDLGPAFGAVWYGPAQAVARDWIAGRMRGAPTELAPALADAAWRAFSAAAPARATAASARRP